jgi:hypothetical protein
MNIYIYVFIYIYIYLCIFIHVCVINIRLNSISEEHNIPKEKKATLKQITFISYGLQCFDDDHEGVSDMLFLMGKILTSLIKTERPTEQDVSMIMLGRFHVSA